MNPRHVAKLLEKSNLSTQEKAAIRRAPSTPTHSALGYDSANDVEFEGFDAFNEAHKSDPQHGGENPLDVISQTPTGRLWLRTFGIHLLGGSPATLNEDAKALLPVLLSTKSDSVRTTVSRALRCLVRFHADALTHSLRDEINEALVTVGTGLVMA